MDERGASAEGKRSGALEGREASLEALALALFEELAPLEVFEGLEAFESFEGWDALEAGAGPFEVAGALAGPEALRGAAASVFFGGGLAFGGWRWDFGGLAFAFPPFDQ